MITHTGGNAMKKLMLITLISGYILNASNNDDTPLTQGYRERTQQEYEALLKKKEEIQDKIDTLVAVGTKIEEQDKDNTVEAHVWHTLTDKLKELEVEQQDVRMDLEFTEAALNLWDKLSGQQKILEQISASLKNFGSSSYNTNTAFNDHDANKPSPLDTNTVATKSTTTEKATTESYQALRIFCLTVLAYISLSALTSHS